MSLKALTLSLLLISPCFAQLDYVLAQKDNILIRIPQVEKLNGKTFLIQEDGFVTIPSVGRIRAAGLTVKSLEKEINQSLRRAATGEPKAVVLVVNRRKVNRAASERTPFK